MVNHSQPPLITMVSSRHTIWPIIALILACALHLQPSGARILAESEPATTESSSSTSDSSTDISKVYAVYFPQYHVDATNDRLWGENFTDWVRLKNVMSSSNRLNKTIPTPTDELGYYDLMNVTVRQRHGELAKEYGVDGFLYYHYWFGIAGSDPVLARSLQQMLVDGEPNIPFAFIWANEQWVASWHGASVKTMKSKNMVLMAQTYSDPESHYQYLRRFFHHKNYIKVHGKPLFMPYHTSLKKPRRVYLLPEVIEYLRALETLAVNDGFPGLHMPFPSIASKSELYAGVSMITPCKRDEFNDTRKSIVTGGSDSPCAWMVKKDGVPTNFPHDLFTGVSYIAYPVTLPNRQTQIPLRCKGNSSLLYDAGDMEPLYFGLTTTFDHSIRRTWGDAFIWDRSFSGKSAADSFEIDVVRALYYEKCCQSAESRNRGGKFTMINAWNEWGEGMVIEPSNAYGLSFLQAIRNGRAIAADIGCNWEALVSRVGAES
jgi:hypothetical protein